MMRPQSLNIMIEAVVVAVVEVVVRSEKMNIIFCNSFVSQMNQSISYTHSSFSSAFATV